MTAAEPVPVVPSLTDAPGSNAATVVFTANTTAIAGATAPTPAAAVAVDDALVT